MKLVAWVEAQPSERRGTFVYSSLLKAMPHEFTIPTESAKAAEEWCNKCVANEDFVSVGYRFFFKNDNDALMFKLTWC
jgi:hypothetical protein